MAFFSKIKLHTYQRRKFVFRYLLSVHHQHRRRANPIATEQLNNNNTAGAVADGGDEAVDMPDMPLPMFWHEHCLRCIECGKQLDATAVSCFVRNGHVFCREDDAK